MAPPTQVRIIKVVTKDESSVAVNNIKKQYSALNKNIKQTGKYMQSMQGYLSRLKTAFAGLAAYMGVRELARSADAFQLIKDRIRALWGEGEDAEAIFKQIAKTANEVNAPVETLADGFARISISAKGMGLSVQDTMDLVKSLQQQLRLSGASVAEVNSVFLQFSQAMGLGRIQGQELRAVMLGSAKTAELLAKIFNTTKGKLRDFGEKGLLTAEKSARGLIKFLPELNKQAATLKVTFGQAMIKLLDAFRTRIDALNTSIGGSTGFNNTIQALIKNMDIFIALATSLVTGAILYKIAAGFEAIFNAFLSTKVTAAFAAIGPKGWIILGITALAGAIAGAMVLFSKQEKVATKSIDKLLVLDKLQRQRAIAQYDINQLEQEASDLARRGRALGEDKMEILLRSRIRLASLDQRIKKQKELIKLGNNLKKADPVDKKLTDLAKLNRTYDRLTGVTKEYVRSLEKIEMKEIDQKFEQDKISAVEYEAQLDKISKKFDDLIAKIEDLENKDSVFHGIRRGAESVIDDIGTVAEMTSDVTSKAFKHLEDNLFEFVKKGKFEFGKFAQAIMDDITRMVIRMSIIRPLASALASGISGGGLEQGGTTTANFEAAKGAVLSKGNVIPFASGGVVGSPTYFGMSGGRTGLMGEAGPEAIMPLTRGPNGRLGVDASGAGTVVNVYNQSEGTETETKRSQTSDGKEQIDVYIKQKVTEGFNEGRYDKTLQGLYGLQRRGA